MSILLDILSKYWGHQVFRPRQREIIEAVLAGEDVLALLPTGGGKSICFQVPALAQEGVCLVVSPLVALMKDQVDNLKKKRIQAEALYAGQSYREQDRILDNCIYGHVKLLYVSPERLRSEMFQVRLAKMNVSLLAVDEAHCISEWGNDFRPAYLDIHLVRDLKPHVPCIALTASATPKVQEDIQAKLKLRKTRVFRSSFVRTNLVLECVDTEQKEKDILQRLAKTTGQGIVYVRSRKAAKELTMFFIRNKISATFYHAGIPHAERERAMEAWVQGKCRVMVATNAFGMGIDKENVRFVYHYDVPESIEAYYQEAGRAGRDGQHASCVQYFHPGDLRAVSDKLQKSFPSVEYIRAVYQHLANYFRLAIGSAALEAFDFDFDDFRTKYMLEVVPTYNALKRLEEEGYILLDESFYAASKAHIPVAYETLYEFQIKHPRLDLCIKAMLRLYGGDIFTHYVHISESKLASYLQISPTELSQFLKVLTERGIVLYEPSNSVPKLTYLTPRLDPATMQIDRKRLETLKRNKEDKQNQMVHYIQNTKMCRMSFMVEYFGEQAEKDCGICDVCQQKKWTESEVHALVKNFLAHHGTNLHGLFEQYPHLPKELVHRIARNLTSPL